jgi:hypothetical protein
MHDNLPMTYLYVINEISVKYIKTYRGILI